MSSRRLELQSHAWTKGGAFYEVIVQGERSGGVAEDDESYVEALPA